MSLEARYAANATVVLTVGHSNMPLTDFLESLHERGVRRIVDVRSAPYSRYVPHFNREPLEAALEAAGIAYGHAGEFLGGRPTDPTCYFSGELPDGKANYLELVNYAEVARRDWYLRGIDRLIERAMQGTTAILCSEEDPARCHRHRLIARTLLQRGIEVLHIRANGGFEPASTTEERIVAEENSAQLGLFDALETR